MHILLKEKKMLFIYIPLLSHFIFFNDIFISGILISSPIRNEVCYLFRTNAIMLRLSLSVNHQGWELVWADSRTTVHHGLLVVVVLFEKGLDAISSKQKCILCHSLLILPVVVVDMLLIKVVLCVGRGIRGCHPFVYEVLPWKVVKPWMRLYLLVTIQT